MKTFVKCVSVEYGKLHNIVKFEKTDWSDDYNLVDDLKITVPAKQNSPFQIGVNYELQIKEYPIN